MKPQKRESIVNVSLFVLTALLFCSMLFLCWKNIALLTGEQGRQDTALPASEKWQLVGGVSDGRTALISLIRPCMIGEKNADGLFFALPDADSYEIYEEKLDGALSHVLGGKAVHIRFADDEERAAYCDRITASPSFLYGALYAPLPLEALPSGLRAEGEYTAEEASFAVRTVFVLPDNEGTAYAVCFDDTYQAIELYAPDAGIPYTRIDAEYGKNKTPSRVEGAFVSGTPICRTTKSCTVGAVTKIPALAYVEGEMDDEITLSLLESFSFHPTIVKSFRTASEDAVSFVENGKELYVSFDDGMLTFRSDGGGIPLSSVLKYYPGGSSYTFDDRMRAVRAFIRSLDTHLTGGDASLTLVGVTHRQNDTVFELKYLHGGVVVTSNDADMTVCVSADAITDVEMYPYEVHAIVRRLPLLPASSLLSETAQPMIGVYTFGGDISDGVLFAAETKQQDS